MHDIGVDFFGIGDEDLVEQRIIDRTTHGRTSITSTFESRIYRDAEIDAGRGCRAEDVFDVVKKSVVGTDKAGITGIVDVEVGVAICRGICSGASGIYRVGVVEGKVAGISGRNAGSVGEDAGRSNRTRRSGAIVGGPSCNV